MFEHIVVGAACLVIGWSLRYLFPAKIPAGPKAPGVEKRAIMPNVWFAIGAPLGVIVSLSLIEGAFNIQIPGELWGIIGAVASKSMDLAQMIVSGESKETEGG